MENRLIRTVLRLLNARQKSSIRGTWLHRLIRKIIILTMKRNPSVRPGLKTANFYRGATITFWNEDTISHSSRSFLTETVWFRQSFFSRVLKQRACTCLVSVRLQQLRSGRSCIKSSERASLEGKGGQRLIYVFQMRKSRRAFIFGTQSTNKGARMHPKSVNQRRMPGVKKVRSLLKA